MTAVSSPVPTGRGGGSFFSSIQGPLAYAESYSWSAVYTPVTIGTVFVTVNQAHNETVTSTSYHTEHLQSYPDLNLAGHSRTDVDSAGTVTSTVHGPYGQVTTLTFPTNYLEVSDSFTWSALLPTFTQNGTCCGATRTISPAPSHEPIPTSTASINSDDPRGWLYSLVSVSVPNSEVLDFWGGRSFTIPYSGCHHQLCSTSPPATAAASAPTFQNQQAYLLATSTTTLSSIPLNGDGGGGGGGPTTTPTAQPDNQNPPPTTSISSPQPDMHSQPGSPPPGTMPTQNPGGMTTDVPPTQPQHGQPQSTDVAPMHSQPDNPSPGTMPNQPQHGQPQPPNGAPVLTIGPSVVTPNSATQYIVGDQTLAPGSAIEVSGTHFSLPSGGSQVVVGTEPSNPDSGTTPPPNMPSGALPPFTFGNTVVTPNSADVYVVDGHTLTSGSVAVVSGTSISLAAGGSPVVVGSTPASSSPSSAPSTSESSGGTSPASQTSGTIGRRGWSKISSVCMVIMVLLSCML